MLAGVAFAEPVVEASGDSLPAFKLTTHLDRVDRGSPRGLAESYAQLQRDQFQVRRHFQLLFYDAHLEVMRRHYDRALVGMQEDVYKKALGVPAVTCKVETMRGAGDVATAMLDWTFGPQKQQLRLNMRRADGKWKIESVFARRGQGPWIERKVQPPRAHTPTTLPEKVTAPVTARDRVRALYFDIRQLRKASSTGYQALAARFAALTSAFFDEAAPTPKPAKDRGIRFEIGKAKAKDGGASRVEMLMTESVPGTEKHSAVGNTAFDLQEKKDGWRITAEYMRPRPDGGFVPTLQNFGLAFQMG